MWHTKSGEGPLERAHSWSRFGVRTGFALNERELSRPPAGLLRRGLLANFADVVRLQPERKVDHLHDQTAYRQEDTCSQLGSYPVRVFINGQPAANPTTYVLHNHDNIVIGYGPPGSFPTAVPFAWPSGL